MNIYEHIHKAQFATEINEKEKKMVRINMTDCIKTETYAGEEGFYINIVENKMEKSFEAWIWNQNYGVKDLMFAVPEEQQTKNEFKEIVWKNFENYKKQYEKDWMEK